MASIFEYLRDKKAIIPPREITEVEYEVISGSIAYGVSDPSDMDVVGITIPSKTTIFPHLKGDIIGFGTQKSNFESYQQHHISYDGKDYDLTIYNIVKFFSLTMDANPNMLDMLYEPSNCVLKISKIGTLIRDHRSLFLSKNVFHRFKGYAFSQLAKAKNRNPEGKRKAIVDQFGYDVKFASHVVRLMDECEQILTEGNINLLRAKEHIKAIRRGEISLSDIEKWFQSKEFELEKIYNTTNIIPYRPDEGAIKTLLITCLEEKFGSIDKTISFNVIQDETLASNKLKRIRDIINE
jgi:predicted nucleotidyltransferase